jgi:hypothetical protein
MKKIILLAAVAALAACSKSEPAPEATEAATAPEAAPAVAAEPLAADGKPSVGMFRVTTAEGEVVMEELKADGTYVDTVDGKVVETGRWNQKSPEQFCFTKDEEGATEKCNTEGVDANGVWTSTNAEGKTATVERIES